MDEFFYNFFITDNKSGHKTKETHLLNKYPDIHKKIIDFCDNDFLQNLPFKQKVWHFIHNEKNIMKCKECDKDLVFKRSIKEGYGIYCSLECTNKNKEHKEKVKKTNIKKYGGISPIHSDDIKYKIKKTNIEKYGVDNTWKRLDLVENGFIKNHGVKHVSEVSGVSERRSITNMKKYGHKNNISIDEVYQKSLTTKRLKFLENYDKYSFYNCDGHILTVHCDECSSIYDIDRNLFKYRDSVNINPCTKCNPINEHVSIQEKDLQKFINTLNVDVIFNDRELVKPKEIDILIPSHKLAIEFDGLYWHSDVYVDNNYHLNKTKLVNSCGYELIHIFEDEWINKSDIVKSVIKNRLGIYDDRVYARKCVIKEIDNKTYNNFLNENHIQGCVKSKIKLGLFYNNDLVSVMSFGGLRKSLGHTSKDGSYEMLRFCNKLNTSVVGGASKLFKYFITNYKPKQIISYSDNRYFNGSLYNKLGFVYEKDTTPNYYYISNGVNRENRFKFRKDILVKEGFDPNKTEKEIMNQRGYNRIYDCGNKKWVWHNHMNNM